MEIFKHLSRTARSYRLMNVNIEEFVRTSSDFVAGYVGVGVGINLSSGEEITDPKLKRAERVKLIGNVNMIIRKCRVLIEPNPVLYEYGSVDSERIIEPGTVPEIFIKLHKDLDLNNLEYLYRVYLAE